MSQKEKINLKFFPFTQETYQKLKEARLTAGEWRLWAYLVTLIPFGDRYVDLPCTLDIQAECEIGKSTYWIAIAKLQDFGLFEIQDKGFSARNLCYPQVKTKQNQANLAESEKPDTESEKPDTDSEKPDTDSEKSDSRSPEPLQDRDGDRSQTIQKIKISQIAEGEGKIFSDPEKGNKPIKPEKAVEICTNILKKQIETTKEEREEEEKKISQEEGVKGKFSAPPISPNKKAIAFEQDPQAQFIASELAKLGVKLQIEEDSANPNGKYQEKLESLGIEWQRIKNAIARAHESQILGAIAHVEVNWEEIKDPSAIFLYQLPKQKIEQISGGKVFRAAEAGYTLDQVKQIYPNNWRQAAAHFGLIVEEVDG